MKDKRLLYLLGAGTLTGLAGTAGAQQQRPNIIYMMADQLRADVLGYAGDGLAVTPNIDRFARQSLDFTNAVSVSPVSAAYRASLITGKYTSSTGMVINELNLNPNHRTLAHVLTDAGYQTGYVGKVHWNDAHRRPYKPGPERMGFDGYWAAYSFNHINYSAFYDTDGPDGEPVHVDLKGQYGPEVFTGLALDYIREHAGDEQPFTLMLSWSPTHDPWVRRNVPAHCYERFKDVKFELPENFNENPDPYMDRFFSEYFNGRTSWRDDFVKGEGYQEAMRCYYAMVNSIDEQFGRVVELLDSLGIADNTIVVFTSDHGEMMTSQGRMFKMIFYDEACRIPFLIRCPGAKRGRTDVCLNTPDIAPTLLGLVGLSDSIPAEMEGDDLSFAVRGGKGLEPDFAFMQGMGHTHLWRNGFEWRAVRDKRYTYARYLRDGSELLFDRQKDPHMTRNVAEDKKYAKVLASLRSGMAAKMEELNDEFKPCTWYRDHWMYKDFSIKAAAHGEFGPLPPIEPVRVRKEFRRSAKKYILPQGGCIFWNSIRVTPSPAPWIGSPLRWLP